MPQNGLRNAAAGVAVTIGVDGFCHFGVGFAAMKKLICHGDNYVLFHTSKLCRSSSYSLGTLGLATHDEHRFSKRGASSCNPPESVMTK